MKILYTINSGTFGGAEKHVLDLVEGMYARGHEVFVWCQGGPMAKEYEEFGANVVKIKIGFDFDPSYIFALTKFLKQNKIDLVHAHELKAVGNTLLAAVFSGVKVRVSHTHTPISEWRISGLKKFINIKLFYSPFVNFLSTREIALTSSRKRVKISEGIKESKLEIIPNGLKMELFSVTALEKDRYKKEILKKYKIPANAYVFGNLGRLSVEKGLPVLIDGFAKFLEKAPNESELIYLLIAGGGDEIKEKLENKIVELNLEQKIVLAGESFAEEDKIKLFSAFNIFVFPSLAEGFGIVPIEAMAMELPVISSDLEVLQEVGGSSAMFFETGNAENLAEKMFNFYSKREKLVEFGKEARRRVETLYSMHDFIDSYENLYFELLEANK